MGYHMGHYAGMHNRMIMWVKYLYVSCKFTYLVYITVGFQNH